MKTHSKELTIILEKAREETIEVMKKLDEKLSEYQKLQDYYQSLNIIWDFEEIVERHDSNWCEWSLTGYDDDGNRYTANTQSDGSHPVLGDDCIVDIELDNIKSKYITDLNDKDIDYNYGIYQAKSIDGFVRYQVRKWNKSLERWMFLSIFTYAYEAEVEWRKLNNAR